MISSSIRIGVLFSLLIFVLHAKAQYTQNERSLDYVYQKGVNALHQGDTLTAFQYIESAYHFEAKQENSKENNIEDINYYYTYLSLVLDKPRAENLAIQYLKSSKNIIFNARINFFLGQYYFKKQNTLEALNAFDKVSIADLNNKELITLKYLQGYLYFKLGNWDKATNLLNSSRQLKQSQYYTDANYYAGFIALQKKDFTLALSCFEIASNNEAYAILTPFYISQIHYFNGNIDAAMQSCEKALSIEGQYYNLPLQQLMGHLLFEKKQYQKAIPYLAKYVAAQQKVEVQDLYQLSFSYFQDQQWEKSISGFKKLANVEDSLGQNSMYLLGTAYLKVNDKNGAKNAFMLCSSKSINLAQKEISLFNYGKLLVELREYSLAISVLDRFMDNYPQSVNYAESKSLWITALAFNNNFKQAIEAYQLIETPSLELLKIYPAILYGLSCNYINDGEVEKAYALLNQLKNAPYNGNFLSAAHFWLGEISYKMGKITDAIGYLQKFMLDPVENGEVKTANARYILGYCYLKSGEYQKALLQFKEISNLNGITSLDIYQQDAYVRIGDCQMMLKKINDALVTYQHIIDLSWSYADYAFLQKSILLGGMGKVSEKIKMLTNYENSFPNSVYVNDARMELADTYISQEKFQDAIAPLSKISLDRSASKFYPQAYYKLGIVYFNLDKNQMALQTFKDLYSNYPNSTESENAIEYIRNIFIEDQTPELYVQFMNEYGHPLTVNEQDSLIFRAAVLKYEQKKYTESAVGLVSYLQKFPNGKYSLEATHLVAEIAYSKQAYDTALVYFSIIADKAPNIYAERAALIAARLNYFNFQNYQLAEKYFSILLNIATQKENTTEANKGLLRCQFKGEKWEEASKIAQEILADKNSATDDIEMANMTIYHQKLIAGDTITALQIINKVIKTGSSIITAEAHYQLANLFIVQNKLNLAEKTAFDIIKKQASYEYWVTKTYILLGDIYVAQNDTFNAIATYKSVADNASIEPLKIVAAQKLKELTETPTIK
jgi:tetratricopeptide (TPR) repeat protein